MRQKKYTSLIAFSVILLFIIAGCKGGGKEKVDQSQNPFIGGTQALDITFEKNSPPEEVSDGGNFPFQAVVTLKNKGEFDLKKGQVKISLTGFDPSVFGVAAAEVNALFDQQPDNDPIPRKKDPDGKITEFVQTSKTFPSTGKFFNVADIVGKPTFNFRTDACYLYQTTVFSYICVLENLVNPAPNPICEPAGAKDVFSSGSPITVTLVEQSVSGNDNIRFNFLIKHLGKGRIFSPDKAANCPRSIADARQAEDLVKVTVDTGLLTQNLRCSGLEGGSTGKIKLFENEATVICTQQLASGRRGDFTPIVKIILDFNYLDTADAQVTVKDVFTPSGEEAGRQRQDSAGVSALCGGSGQPCCGAQTAGASDDTCTSGTCPSKNSPPGTPICP